jgi:hypothetical protein
MVTKMARCMGLSTRVAAAAAESGGSSREPHSGALDPPAGEGPDAVARTCLICGTRIGRIAQHSTAQQGERSARDAEPNTQLQPCGAP